MSTHGDRARAGLYAGGDMAKRAYHELVGLCRGILADNHVSDEEVVALEQWCKAYPEVACTWPGDVVARRVSLVLEDGVIDDEERRDLKDLLEQLTGQVDDVIDAPTSLPLDDPAPNVIIAGHSFCFTGTFAFGRRKACEQVVGSAGGTISKGVNRKLNYLVIGSRITPAWAHSTHGRKIEAAVTVREDGHPLYIVAESHWSRAILAPSRP